MINKENAPGGVESSTGAELKTQVNDTTTDKQIPIELISEFMSMQMRFKELYVKTGLLSIEPHGVHINEAHFRDTFTNYEVEFRQSTDEWPYKLIAKVFGVTFFTISAEV